MSKNLYIALGKLQEELQAYTELNINGPLKKNIYISPWRYKNLAIRLEGILIVVLSEMARNSMKKAVFIVLLSPPSLNSQITATNNILLAIKSKAPRRNRYSTKDSQQVLILYKANSKSKLGEGKKWNHLGLTVYSFKENSEGKPVKYKKLDNSKTKSGRHNKWP